MRYPIAIEPGTGATCFGVVVPDLPGCFSAGDTVEDAAANARDAIATWLEDALEKGEIIPMPTSLNVVRQNPDFAGWLFDSVEVSSDEEAVMRWIEDVSDTEGWTA